MASCPVASYPAAFTVPTYRAGRAACRRLPRCLRRPACWATSSLLSGPPLGARPRRWAVGPRTLSGRVAGTAAGTLQHLRKRCSASIMPLLSCLLCIYCSQVPPTDRRYRAALATAIEPCGASFRRLVAAALTSESRLLRSAVVRVLARAAGEHRRQTVGGGRVGQAGVGWGGLGEDRRLKPGSLQAQAVRAHSCSLFSAPQAWAAAWAPS